MFFIWLTSTSTACFGPPSLYSRSNQIGTGPAEPTLCASCANQLNITCTFSAHTPNNQFPRQQCGCVSASARVCPHECVCVCVCVCLCVSVCARYYVKRRKHFLAVRSVTLNEAGGQWVCLLRPSNQTKQLSRRNTVAIASAGEGCWRALGPPEKLMGLATHSTPH